MPFVFLRWALLHWPGRLAGFPGPPWGSPDPSGSSLRRFRELFRV